MPSASRGGAKGACEPTIIFVPQLAAPAGFVNQKGTPVLVTVAFNARDGVGLSEPQHHASRHVASRMNHSFSEASVVSRPTSWITADGVWKHRSDSTPYQDDVRERKRQLPRILASRIGCTREPRMVADGDHSQPRTPSYASRPALPQMHRLLGDGCSQDDDFDRRVRSIHGAFAKSTPSIPVASRPFTPLNSRMEELARPRKLKDQYGDCFDLAGPSLGCDGAGKPQVRRKNHIPATPARFASPSEKRVDAGVGLTPTPTKNSMPKHKIPASSSEKKERTTKVPSTHKKAALSSDAGASPAEPAGQEGCVSASVAEPTAPGAVGERTTPAEVSPRTASPRAQTDTPESHSSCAARAAGAASASLPSSSQSGSSPSASRSSSHSASSSRSGSSSARAKSSERDDRSSDGKAEVERLESQADDAPEEPPPEQPPAQDAEANVERFESQADVPEEPSPEQPPAAQDAEASATDVFAAMPDGEGSPAQVDRGDSAPLGQTVQPSGDDEFEASASIPAASPTNEFEASYEQFENSANATDLAGPQPEADVDAGRGCNAGIGDGGEVSAIADPGIVAQSVLDNSAYASDGFEDSVDSGAADARDTSQFSSSEQTQERQPWSRGSALSSVAEKQEAEAFEASQSADFEASMSGTEMKKMGVTGGYSMDFDDDQDGESAAGSSMRSSPSSPLRSAGQTGGSMGSAMQEGSDDVSNDDAGRTSASG